jgi:hypothetical protein
LGYAHNTGILHRNLCPENIFLSGDGSIKIRDFAIAHILMRHLPHPGVRWGAPIYISPEQIEHKECLTQSDIFALGVIFYELLTGVHPFYAPDGNKVLDNILQDIEIPTFEQYPDFHPRIWQILKTCLAKNPGDRYQNVDAMLDAFRGLLQDMAEDVQLMLSELQSSFASLKVAAERPGASDNIISLCGKVGNLLQGKDKTEYSRLDRLTTELLDLYPEIREATSEQNIFESLLDPEISPEELQTAGEEDTLKEKAAWFPEQREQAEGMDNASSPPKRSTGIPRQQKGSPEAPLSETAVDIPGASVEDAALKNEGGHPAAAAESATATFSPEPIEDMKKENPAPVEIGGIPVAQGNAATQDFSEANTVRSVRRKFNRRRFKVIFRPIRRIGIAVASVLVFALAVYSFQQSGVGGSLHSALKNYVLGPLTNAKASTTEKDSSGAGATVAMKSEEFLSELDESKNETVFMDELEESLPGENLSSLSQDRLDRVAVLIGAGKLQEVKAELDRLRRLYPESPDVNALYKRWQNEISRSGGEKREEEKSLETVRKEAAWNRQFTDLFVQGRYREAENVTELWMEDLPQSGGARQSASAVKEIQARMAASNAAVERSRYGEALQELSAAERINPSDPAIADLRNEIESRLGSARGVLNVYRLGDKASLLLDGNRIGNDGEIAGQSIPIGSHEITVEKEGLPVASRRQEFLEDQTMTLVYDLDRKIIRPMIESDELLIDHRKSIEESFRFTSEHKHGIFRGSCRGELILSAKEVHFNPSSGSHGFRVPFKILKLEHNGKNIDLHFVSDNEHFKKFEFDDEESATKFIQAWNKLKALQGL